MKDYYGKEEIQIWVLVAFRKFRHPLSTPSTLKPSKSLGNFCLFDGLSVDAILQEGISMCERKWLGKRPSVLCDGYTIILLCNYVNYIYLIQ